MLEEQTQTRPGLGVMSLDKILPTDLHVCVCVCSTKLLPLCVNTCVCVCVCSSVCKRSFTRLPLNVHYVGMHVGNVCVNAGGQGGQMGGLVFDWHVPQRSAPSS